MDRVSSSAARGAIHSTKISGNFGSKLNGSVRSNRKSFEKTGPPFEVDQFSRSHRLEFQLNGSRPHSESETVLDYFIWDHTLLFIALFVITYLVNSAGCYVGIIISLCV